MTRRASCSSRRPASDSPHSPIVFDHCTPTRCRKSSRSTSRTATHRIWRGSRRAFVDQGHMSRMQLASSPASHTPSLLQFPPGRPPPPPPVTHVMQPVRSPPGQVPEPGTMHAAHALMSGAGDGHVAEPEPEPEPPPPLVQSFGHDVGLSPVSHVLLPQIALPPPPPPPPPLPQSALQLATSLAAQTPSPQTPPPPAASGPGGSSWPLPSPHEQPTTNEAQANTSAVILIMGRHPTKPKYEINAKVTLADDCCVAACVWGQLSSSTTHVVQTPRFLVGEVWARTPSTTVLTRPVVA